MILGLVQRDDEPKDKRLYSYADINGNPAESRHAALSPYLFDASKLQNRHLVVEEVNRPLKDVKRPVIGSKPIDGGYYIFTEDECAEFLTAEPGAKEFLRPYIGSDEFINGEVRYILALQTASPHALRALPKIIERINNVSRFRRGEISSKKEFNEGRIEGKKRAKDTIKLASNPQSYHVNVIPDAPFLAIPKVSSERRNYVPIGWLEPPIVPSDLVFVLRHADLWDFGLITSRMHMAWLRNIGGRLESRYRYSIGVVYNPFPWPDAPDEKARAKIGNLAQAVLDARKHHPESTLADLYDPDVMPIDLRRAHRELDEAVDRLYRKEQFLSDRERVEHLFTLYEKLTAPVLAAAAPDRSRRRRFS